MAQYIAQVYATDSWQDTASGDNETRGETLRSRLTFDGRDDDIPKTVSTATGIYLVFPSYTTVTQYTKKRFLQKSGIYAYVTAYTKDEGEACRYGNSSTHETIFYDMDDVAVFPLSNDRIVKDYSSSASFQSVPSSTGYKNLPFYSTADYDRLYYATFGFQPDHWEDNGEPFGYVEYYDIVSSYTVYSHTSSNAPYANYTFEDVIPSATNLYPAANGNAPKFAENTFSWKFTYNTTNVGTTLTQKSAKFRWRPFGTTTYTEIAVGTDQFIKIPASTFSTAYIEYQVVVTSDDNIEGTASAWTKLSTADGITTAEVISPKNTVFDGTIDNIFKWRNVNNVPQTKYDIQYSTNGGSSWIALSSATTPIQTYIVPANTFSAGTVLWRVRTYNSENVVGNWSTNAEFIVKAMPPAPFILTCTTNPRPTITWQSDEQQAFKIKAGEYYSDIMYGTAKQFNIPVYLADGATEIGISIQNEYGLWSGWTTTTIVIANTVGQEITLSSRVANNSIILEWNTGDYFKYYVYRDDMLIGKTTNNIYKDYFCNGKHSYKIRGVMSDDNYTLSNSISEILVCKCDVLSAVDTIDWIPLKYKQGGLLTRTFSKISDVTYLNFSGRTKPIACKNGYTSRKANYNFSLLNREYIDKLDALVGETVICKDNRGNIIIGILNDYQTESGRYFDLSYTITETDFMEDIEYDSE